MKLKLNDTPTTIEASSLRCGRTFSGRPLVRLLDKEDALSVSCVCVLCKLGVSRQALNARRTYAYMMPRIVSLRAAAFASTRPIWCVCWELIPFHSPAG